VFFVDDLVEGLDLSAFERRYDALGERAYPPGDASQAVAARRDHGRVQRPGDRAAAVMGSTLLVRGWGAAAGLPHYLRCWLRALGEVVRQRFSGPKQPTEP